VRRYLNAGTLIPLVLALIGLAVIVAGRLIDEGVPAGPSLPPIVRQSPPVGHATPSPSLPSPTGPTATFSPSPTPVPEDWVAVQLEIEAVDINVAVREATSSSVCNFPPLDGAYILCDGSQPGRGTNSFIFAHARVGLFLNLWNVRLGDRVEILMSDGDVLEYVVSEIHANVACPDPDAPPHPNPPLALVHRTDCAAAGFWTAPTEHERLTLQTSQGLNRNWGEFIVVAEPVSPGAG